MTDKIWRIIAVAVLGAFVEWGFATQYPFYIQAIATAGFFVLFGVCFMAGIEYHREAK